MALSQDTQQRLLDAAGQVFAEKGFKAATVREICDLAAVNLAAVNYHFGDKEHLYMATVRHAVQCKLGQVPLPQWPAGTPARTKLRDFIRLAVHSLVLEESSQPWQMQLITRELMQPRGAVQEVAREFVRPIFQGLWGILREILPPEVPEKKLHLIAFSIMGQFFYFRVARHGIPQIVGEEEFRGYDAATLAEHFADFNLAALGVEPPLTNRKEARP